MDGHLRSSRKKDKSSSFPHHKSSITKVKEHEREEAAAAAAAAASESTTNTNSTTPRDNSILLLQSPRPGGEQGGLVPATGLKQMQVSGTGQEAPPVLRRCDANTFSSGKEGEEARAKEREKVREKVREKTQAVTTEEHSALEFEKRLVSLKASIYICMSLLPLSFFL